MRETKFRVWDNELHIMLYSETQDYPFVWYIDNAGIRITEHDGTDWIDLKNIEVMQFTGLKDKNGKEIYEGDILAYSDKSEKATVDWGWNCGCCDGVYGFTTHSCSVDLACHATLEIIGNIHENKELLEDKNE